MTRIKRHSILAAIIGYAVLQLIRFDANFCAGGNVCDADLFASAEMFITSAALYFGQLVFIPLLNGFAAVLLGWAVFIPLFLLFALARRFLKRLERSLGFIFAGMIGIFSLLVVSFAFVYADIRVRYFLDGLSGADSGGGRISDTRWETYRGHEEEIRWEAFRRSVVPGAFGSPCANPEPEICDMEVKISESLWNARNFFLGSTAGLNGVFACCVNLLMFYFCAKSVGSAAPSPSERILAALAHGSIILPVVGIAVPYIIWSTRKEKSQFVAFQSRQAWIYQAALNAACYLALIFYSCIFAAPLMFRIWDDPTLVLLSLLLLALLLAIVLMMLLHGIFGSIMVFAGRSFRYAVLGRRVERSMTQKADPPT
jgi:uncharacterized Tic20 family protein